MALGLLAPSARAADRIIFRNLDVITDKTVVDFDANGVRLNDRSLIGWDEIERAKVAADKQARFDALLKELGTHLYRVRQRLSVGDYAGVLPHAEAVYPRYVNHSSPTAYMVFQGLMWARLAMGRREEAVEPYLRCFGYLKTPGASVAALPGKRRLVFDRQTGMSRELQPIWFDQAAARAVLPAVYQAIRTMPEPRPEGTRVYYGTLALAAGQRDQAMVVLKGIQGRHPALAQLRNIAAAQDEVMRGSPGPAASGLEREWETFLPTNKPLALYWVGRAKAASSQHSVRQEGILQLLRLPAVYGEAYPELAAAGLYQTIRAMEASGDTDSLAAVRQELLKHYGHTYHAGSVKAELTPHTDR
jgi:hypothetical protein